MDGFLPDEVDDKQVENNLQTSITQARIDLDHLQDKNRAHEDWTSLCWWLRPFPFLFFFFFFFFLFKISSTHENQIIIQFNSKDFMEMTTSKKAPEKVQDFNSIKII